MTWSLPSPPNREVERGRTGTSGAEVSRHPTSCRVVKEEGGRLFRHASLTPADECGRWEEGARNGLEPTLSGKARCWRDGA